MPSWLHTTNAILLSVILFIGMIFMVLFGRRAARRWDADEEPKGGIGKLLGGMYALAGLVLAFAFGMSGTRYEKARDVIEAEANSIGTAILRADLYSDSVRQIFRADFKDYLEAVIAYYENAADSGRVMESRDDAAKAADKLWSLAAQQSKLPNMLIPSNQMLPALNEMFDIAQRREIVLLSHVPDLIVYGLFICVLTACFVSGFTSKKFRPKDWIIVLGFILISTIVIYTTIDLSRPIRGVINTEAGQNAIKEMRKMF